APATYCATRRSRAATTPRSASSASPAPASAAWRGRRRGRAASYITRDGLAAELLGEALAEPGGPQRRAEGIALGVVAVGHLEALDLLVRLDAFGDHDQVELGRERDDGADDRYLGVRHAAVVAQLHEGRRNLDGVEGEAV